MSTARPSANRPSRGERRARRVLELLPLLIIVLGLAELGLLILIGVKTSLWWPLLIIAVGWIIGFALVVAAGQQSFTRLRSLVRAVRGRGDVQDHLSRPAFTLLAAACFFFPGILTDVLGAILLLTPVQRSAVRSTGLSSGSETARRVLHRRTGPGVIESEIIVEAQPVRRDGEGSGGGSHRAPPIITQG